MDQVTLARWQFGITTVYHYLFVPITISLTMLVAWMQTLWNRTGNDAWLRLTRFYGKLMLINFAMGVVTGLVQEFQFGMNWSEYSRFVGDIFGAPLALEALIAFFLESTFLGLWIFGWDRLPRRIHLACIWLVAIGTVTSSLFILAANSWMQNPVGATFRNGRAELVDFGAVLTNPVFLAHWPHTVAAAYLVGGGLVAGIAGWHLAREAARDQPDTEALTAFRKAIRLGAATLLVSGLACMVSGDLLGKQLTHVQPMKMAAAEALYQTESNAGFSVLTIGSLDGTRELWAFKVPGLLSILSGEQTVTGINTIRDDYHARGFTRADGSQTELQQQFAPELARQQVNPTPNIPVSYWTFRSMIALGILGMGAGVLLLWLTRGNRTPQPSRRWTLLMLVAPLTPLFANSFGWIFTETGRQPWLVTGVLPTAAGVSPTVTSADVLFSMVVYTLLYGVLAVVEVRLFLTYLSKGLPEATPVEITADDAPLSFAY